MEATALALPGCFLLKSRCMADDRGAFFKLLHVPTLKELGLESDVAESYVSSSHRGVIRGLHFQAPPSDHVKMVCCLSGRARDGLLDLRRDSPTYGQALTVDLDGSDDYIVYIARGVAHGFAAWEDRTDMLYMVSSPHDPGRDLGVHWNSVGIDWWPPGWKLDLPVVSARDAALPAWPDIETPFDFRLPT
ncbi:MAG: dTDP-4-dehydrorhamnose 3,5-epimerase family protein [Zoogloea sp.]|uniref:dTDP-4-dehydrorhamnose 3,5-epimerase family protein n=1 Tax=Zoogloea sp. TaxID=49181 RepID=UPI0026119014|nr:dTDP-4-dehydrorhamnose 3,5-epimerase family protein [Zoogloea sp.]MDD3328278.1 dTDP-4-dehydrorhamnose 3,5-epimerase family protein [Zoogloea sp.]